MWLSSQFTIYNLNSLRLFFIVWLLSLLNWSCMLGEILSNLCPHSAKQTSQKKMHTAILLQTDSYNVLSLDVHKMCFWFINPWWVSNSQICIDRPFYLSCLLLGTLIVATRGDTHTLPSIDETMNMDLFRTLQIMFVFLFSFNFLPSCRLPNHQQGKENNYIWYTRMLRSEPIVLNDLSFSLMFKWLELRI